VDATKSTDCKTGTSLYKRTRISHGVDLKRGEQLYGVDEVERIGLTKVPFQRVVS
jgi:hypothetical protein